MSSGQNILGAKHPGYRWNVLVAKC